MNNLPSTIDSYSRWDGGIAGYEKNGDRTQYAHGRSVDVRSDPRSFSLLSRTTKESGSTVTDLPRAGDIVDDVLYYYGDTGNIYKRDTNGDHSLLRSVASSHGSDMAYYAEDDYLYYTLDKTIGRYGQVTLGTPSFSDDFLGSEGGVPQNTHWLDLEAGSSQYATVADDTALSITGDFALEATISPESLPTVGNSMVIASKWDVNLNKRSYKFDIYAISGYFGDGSNGSLTVSSNTTDVPIDSACTGILAATTLSATNASFAAGQVILIHQTQGTGAGTYMRNKIVSYTSGTITLETELNATYTTGAQVLVMKQYTSVTVNSGVTWTAKAWNGTTGGILAFLCNGSTTVSGSISATGKGFRGGAEGRVGISQPQYGENATGAAGDGTGVAVSNGGGAFVDAGALSSGGGGSNATVGSTGYSAPGATTIVGTTDLTSAVFGGGGGGGGANISPYTGAATGGAGGGWVFILAATLTVSGTIVASGSAGSSATDNGGGRGFAGGGGAGGNILLKVQSATLGSSLITATAGAGGTGVGSSETRPGGTGGTGRIRLDYYTSYTGTTNPTISVAQDNTLVTNTTYQLRLGLSSNGTNEEFLTKAASFTPGMSTHVAVSWDASDSQAEFVQDGVSLGTSTGSFTSLNDNASVFAVGASMNNTTPQSLFDGKMDELRLWNTERTAAQFSSNRSRQIASTTGGLAGYWRFNNNYDDETANANALTATNSPVFTTDVPFASPTTRRDLDQSLDTSGDTYALPASISEVDANRQDFVPTKDPLKSIEVNISDTGDSVNWTLTVHDSLNRVVASKTVSAADIRTGDFEFVFDDAVAIVRGATYHFHLTASATTGAPAVVSTSNNDLNTADFHTYYQFLIDTPNHPIEEMLNFLAIGNGRYLATYGADTGYNPHRLVLPSKWRIRALTIWRGYLAIGCTRGDSITNSDEGMIFMWDGVSTTYVDAVPIPEGGINSLFSSKGKLFVFAGYHGDMYVYKGGDSVDETETRRVPKMGSDEYIETMPNAVSMWDGLLRWGVAGESNATEVERGVLSYGKRRPESPLALTYDYPISTGTLASTGVKIGFLKAVGTKLFIGWKDNTVYGMDVVDQTASPFASGTMEQQYNDFNSLWHTKQGLTVRLDTEPLPDDSSVRLKYRFSNNEDWEYSDLFTTTDETVFRFTIDQGEHQEIKIGADIYCDGTISPRAKALTLEENLNKEENFI